MRKHKMMVAGWRGAGLAGSRKALKEVEMENDGNYGKINVAKVKYLFSIRPLSPCPIDDGGREQSSISHALQRNYTPHHHTLHPHKHSSQR
eukprot:scaffold1804_cov66-Cyclotella_meneghiniana.AAC.3